MAISDKIHTVENDFSNRFGFSLFSNSPVNQVSSIENKVSNIDDFISRLASACAIFDHLNKKKMDAEITIPQNGTRKTLEIFLKSKYINNQLFIEEKIFKPLSMACLLRDYLIHGRNRNKNKAIKYFNLNDPIQNHEKSWNSVYNVYSKIFDSLNTLLNMVDVDVFSSNDINQETEKRLVQQTFDYLSYYFENRQSSILIKEVIDSGPVTDSELADLLNTSKEQIRLLLYPFQKKLLVLEYEGENETKISFCPYFYQFKEMLYKTMQDAK